MGTGWEVWKEDQVDFPRIPKSMSIILLIKPWISLIHGCNSSTR